MTETDNPWKTLGSKKIYDNPWIQVIEDDVINPSGKPGIYGKISFKNLACGIIPLDEDMNTWIVGQYRYALGSYSWEIPMGGVPRNEDLLEGAKRELKEETGLTADTWEAILNVHVSNSITDEEGIVFVARSLTQGEPDFEDTEDIKIRRLPFAQVLKMALTGEITDLLSLAGIMKLAALHALE
jgi:ADP-ribose pyrophosphatase